MLVLTGWRFVVGGSEDDTAAVDVAMSNLLDVECMKLLDQSKGHKESIFQRWDDDIVIWFLRLVRLLDKLK